MTLNFYEKGEFLKKWVNWEIIPTIGDIVVLHFGDRNDDEERYVVIGRTIDGTKPDSIRIDVYKK